MDFDGIVVIKKRGPKNSARKETKLLCWFRTVCGATAFTFAAVLAFAAIVAGLASTLALAAVLAFTSMFVCVCIHAAKQHGADSGVVAAG